MVLVIASYRVAQTANCAIKALSMIDGDSKLTRRFRQSHANGLPTTREKPDHAKTTRDKRQGIKEEKKRY